MAYNRKNILKRVIEIQSLTLEQTNRGVTQEWVFNNIVFPTYLISRATYYRYLGMNAKKQLKEIEGME